MIRRNWLLLIFLSFTIPSLAQERSGTDYKFRASFIPGGLTYINGFKGSDNMFTDYYLKTATSGRANFLTLELAYKTKRSFIIFGRYEFLTIPWPDNLNNHSEFMENQYKSHLRSSGHEILYSNINGGKMSLDGFTLGTGYSFKLKPFSVEPYLAMRGILWKPYQIFVLYKNIEGNHYFQEEYNGKNYLAFSPVGGVKLNLRINGTFGISMEPSYALMPLQISYDYSLKDSQGLSKQINIEEKFLLSIYQINFGIYFNLLKR